MDPIADMLTRIRNATTAGQSETNVPYSQLKARIAEVLLRHGFLAGLNEDQLESGRKQLRLTFEYSNGESAIRSIRRLSKPGLRIYRKANELPRPKGGFGIVVVSTPRGIMTTDQARRERAGGELICEVLS